LNSISLSSIACLIFSNSSEKEIGSMFFVFAPILIVNGEANKNAR